MTIGFRPEGKLLCPFQTDAPHRIVWVAAAFGDHDTVEYFRCETCPRALIVRDGVIEQRPGREVAVLMDGPPSRSRSAHSLSRKVDRRGRTL
jgi:hypothetical protein